MNPCLFSSYFTFTEPKQPILTPWISPPKHAGPKPWSGWKGTYYSIILHIY